MNLGYIWRRLDVPLFLATMILLAVGLVVLQAINFKDSSLAQDFSPNKQIFSAAIGLIVMTILARVDYRVWSKLGKYWYGIGIVLLLLVLVIGNVSLGATRSIDFGLLQFQPTEFIKLGLIMVLAHYFTQKAVELKQPKYLLLSLVYLLPPLILIAIQPDLGSAMVLGFIWLVMVLTSNASKLQLGLILAGGLALLPIAANLLQPYQQERLQTFLNPLADPEGSGYNVVQSQIAVGSGGLFGKGLGGGTQSQLNFLPSQHTDFIFAVTAEKLGFLGAGLVLILFAIILVRAVRIAMRSEDQSAVLIASGITAMLLFHVVINIGMNLGIMPVTGIPLPFLSYGGTNLIVSLAAVGLLMSIVIHRKELRFAT